MKPEEVAQKFETKHGFQLVDYAEVGLPIYKLWTDVVSLEPREIPTTCEFILNGGHGAISVTANVVPAKMANMCQLALEGKAAEARAVDAEIAELHRLLFIESNPIPVKWAVSQMGFGELNLRLPMTVLDEKYQQPLRQALISAGAL